MIEVRETERFSHWFRDLRDTGAKARINVRIRRLSLGIFGDVASVGDGVSELRIHEGPGYRVYFAQRGSTLVILLCGGDKASQKRDISTAKAMAEELNG